MELPENMNELSETQKKILDIGKREFLEKGFKSASLRGIVKEAGFTQGAFYGYYPDKEALFTALVSEAADGLIERFKSAQRAHFDLIKKGKTELSRKLSTEYLQLFIGYIYDHFDAFKLVICRSAGTRYEHYIDDLVELEVSITEKYYRLLRTKGKLEGMVSRELHRMITSAYFTAVFETVAHDMPQKKAFDYTKELAVFFNCGWDGILKLT